MNILDNPSTYERLDPAGIGRLVLGLPQQCRDAWEVGSSAPLPEGVQRATGIIIAGMGGSAIGGALVRGLAELESRVPVTVCRDYRLPAWAGPDTLVIASSFSGNTEETLSAYGEALARGCMVMVMTTGGELGRRAGKRGVPAMTYQFDGHPRCAVGYSFMGLLAVLGRAGVLPDKGEDVAAALRVMEAWGSELGPAVPTERNNAKKMAEALHGRIPVVYGAGFLNDVAVRWKSQFNENSKTWAFVEALPEADHNAIEGFGLPGDLLDQLGVVFLKSPHLHKRVLDRIEITAGLLDKQGVRSGWLEGRGETPLAHVLTLVQFGDWVSYYLAMLNEKDPNPIPQIDALKAALARR
jgi:glucose/mannose-6-phosphate isomerase